MSVVKYTSRKIITDVMLISRESKEKIYCVAYDLARNRLGFVSTESIRMGRRFELVILASCHQCPGAIGSQSIIKDKSGSILQGVSKYNFLFDNIFDENAFRQLFETISVHVCQF